MYFFIRNKGWFNFESDAGISIFGSDLASINKENAWLMYCYYETENTSGAQASPTFVSPSEEQTFSVQLSSESKNVYLKVNVTSKIRIEKATNLKIEANGTVYEADENGVLEVELTSAQTFAVIYDGDLNEDINVIFTLV